MINVLKEEYITEVVCASIYLECIPVWILSNGERGVGEAGNIAQKGVNCKAP